LSAQDWLHLLVEAVRDELSCLSDIVNSSRFAFAERPEVDEDARKVLAQPHAVEVLRAFTDGWARLPSHDYGTVEAFFDELRTELKSERGLSGKSVMQPIRAALTGNMKGPCLVAAAALLGRERCLARVRTVLAS
jgi:glutamyl/glutaminyl-tRNA synthetase